MVDYNEMRKKFPTKLKGKKVREAAIKQIAREYERKRSELGLGAPVMRKGIGFYLSVTIALMLAGALVLSATGRGGKPRISRADLEARKSVDALAVALGRFRYHTGSYPTNEEGLEALASTAVSRSGWNGPYIRQVVDDPWGRAYVYADNGPGERPTLYSRGPDGVGGTADDYFPAPELFDEPFRDTSWTLSWMPYRLRGYVVAPDEETKKQVEREVQAVLAANARAAAEEKRKRGDFSSENVTAADLAAAAGRIRERAAGGASVVFERPWAAADKDGGARVEVAVKASGATEAELFVNNVSCGRVEASGGRAVWSEVPFEEGEIKAIAWRDGSYVGEATQRSAGEPFALRLALLDEELGDSEFGYATVEPVDAFGTPVASTIEPAFLMRGPGEIVLTASTPSVMSPGAVTAAFRRRGKSGDALSLDVAAPGLRPAFATIPWKERQ